MQTISYSLFSPGGNRTALVFESIPENYKNALALEILAKEPYLEQVGFVTGSPTGALHLEMAGGEFCGNAARCLAYWLKAQTGNERSRFYVSGYKDEVKGFVSTRELAGITLGKDFIVKSTVVENGTLVEMQGIRFLIIGNANPDKFFETAKAYISEAKAMGVITTKMGLDGKLEIDPWVWVPGVQTWVDETACGSGSIAAAYIFWQSNSDQKSYRVLQPSGSVLEVNFMLADKNISEISLNGPVVLEGEHFVVLNEKK